MERRVRWPWLVIGIALVGCEGASGEAFRMAPSAIRGGEPAPEHGAVVALYADREGNGLEFQASGTILYADADGGIVLTCEHCMQPPPVELRVGQDLTSPDAVFPVGEVAIHPGGLDLALLTFSGDASGLEAIAPLSPWDDAVAAGTSLVHVGYGFDGTTFPDARMKTTDEVARGRLDQLQYTQSTSGPCFGDSGGPGLYELDGLPLVAGVIEEGDTDCASWGNDVRVSNSYDTFIVPFATAHVSDTPTCEACLDTALAGSCAEAAAACTGDCAALRDCVQTCAGDAGCRSSCIAAADRDARLALRRVERCLYTQACWIACATDASRPPAPRCGLTWQADEACQSCIETSCCVQGYVCRSQLTCESCAGSAASLLECAASASASTPAVRELEACVTGSCTDVCEAFLEPPEPADDPDTTEPLDPTDTMLVDTASDATTDTRVPVGCAGDDDDGCGCRVRATPSPEWPSWPAWSGWMAMCGWIVSRRRAWWAKTR